MKNMKFFACMALLTACCNNGYCADLIAGENHDEYLSPAGQQRRVQIVLKDSVPLNVDVPKGILPYVKGKIESAGESWQGITIIQIFGIPSPEIDFYDLHIVTPDSNQGQFLKEEYFNRISTLKMVDLVNIRDRGIISYVPVENGKIVPMVYKPEPLTPEMIGRLLRQMSLRGFK